ncbi:MAG: hypothetical protein KAU31_11165, partial [Spirochaetaceae bacterium]|nr:hypothetical protein [Spirochaetaceae bacterium]
LRRPAYGIADPDTNETGGPAGRRHRLGREWPQALNGGAVGLCHANEIDLKIPGVQNRFVILSTHLVPSIIVIWFMLMECKDRAWGSGRAAGPRRGVERIAR